MPETHVMPTVPSWFKQRQAKLEDAGTDTFRVTGPNLPEAFVGIRAHEEGRWGAVFKETAEGPVAEATEPVFEKPTDAWEAAFEIYRQRVVV